MSTQEPDRVNTTSQTISWRVNSKLPVIQFLLEFRLSPLSGMKLLHQNESDILNLPGDGEDWVSLVVPYQPSPDCQSYLLRGLSPDTSYQVRNSVPRICHTWIYLTIQARIRTKTRTGISFHSDLLKFSTYSPWTSSTSPPTRLVR